MANVYTCLPRTDGVHNTLYLFYPNHVEDYVRGGEEENHATLLAIIKTIPPNPVDFFSFRSRSLKNKSRTVA